MLFVGVILLEGALRPGYEPLHRFGSELSLGERGWVQIANFIVSGLLVLGFALGLRRVMGDGRGSAAAPVLAAIFGMCLIVGGVFVTDPKPGYPAGSAGTAEPTVHGLIHDGNPVPFYLSLIALMCVMARRFAAEPGGRPWMWFCVATAVGVPVTFAIAAGLYDAESQTGMYHGLWQRINLAISMGWFGVVAMWFLRRRTRGAQDA
ncbi:DUF998 domain-containing protein [Nonomuraea diastatica]|uniref:DUF998 domain-containing protein n=1 Tax=Nonomuraea diastatica TaxID=1848329 RepID=UPI001409EAFD|nr:DUF998 domain-containing protein [Nonomuraea diastatica]